MRIKINFMRIVYNFMRIELLLHRQKTEFHIRFILELKQILNSHDADRRDPPIAPYWN